MKKTFGQQIKQFALSVDIMDDDTFEQVKRLIQRYVKHELKMNYFELMVETVPLRSTKTKHLKTIWGDYEYMNPIIENGKYTNQTAFAFDKNVPLWVVSKSKSSLANQADHIDYWSGQIELPKFESVEDEIKTAIVIPISLKSGKVIGVIDMESDVYLEKTNIATREILNIADTISIILSLRNFNKSQKQNTLNAIESLAKEVGNNKLQNLSKPKLFFAFPNNCDKIVVETIKNILLDYRDKLTLVFWDEIQSTGNIISQVTNEILTSSFGICYFSEILENGNGYSDNPNVLFESGMFYSLCNINNRTTLGWIPIREKDSPKIPFDFSTERILIVNRRSDNKLEEAKFEEGVRSRVENLINKEN